MIPANRASGNHTRRAREPLCAAISFSASGPDSTALCVRFPGNLHLGYPSTNNEGVNIYILISGSGVLSSRNGYLERVFARSEAAEGGVGLPDNFRVIEIDLTARDAIDFDGPDAPISGPCVNPGYFRSFKR